MIVTFGIEDVPSPQVTIAVTLTEWRRDISPASCLHRYVSRCRSARQLQRQQPTANVSATSTASGTCSDQRVWQVRVCWARVGVRMARHMWPGAIAVTVTGCAVVRVPIRVLVAVPSGAAVAAARASTPVAPGWSG